MEETASNPMKVKFALLVVTLLFALLGVGYFLFLENFRASVIFFYLGICCCVFLHTTYNVMKGKLLEMYTLTYMKLLWKYSIVKMVISLGIIVICTVVGLLSQEDLPQAFRKYYVNLIPALLGLFWSMLFFFDVRAYTDKLTEAQGNAAVFHNAEEQA